MNDPPPPPPPLPADPSAPMPEPVPYATPFAPAMVSRDAEHLRILAICHYVVGGIIAVSSSCGLIHFGMGLMMALNPNAFAPPPGSSGGAPPPPPAFMGWFFALFGGLFVLSGWTLGGLTIYSGRLISKRRRRVFSLVVAGIGCLMMPFGTVLGIFTLIVLMRESVKALYAETPG